MFVFNGNQFNSCDVAYFQLANDVKSMSHDMKHVLDKVFLSCLFTAYTVMNGKNFLRHIEFFFFHV